MSKSETSRTFLISVAAELAGMHAQTLRTYDRLGLVSPQRSSGGGRRYSEHDVDLLREVQRLSHDEGVNLAGIKRIIELTNRVEALQVRVKEMSAELEMLRPARGEMVDFIHERTGEDSTFQAAIGPEEVISVRVLGVLASSSG